MNCALRTIMCALSASLLLSATSTAVLAKEVKDRATDNVASSPAVAPLEFRWNEHGKLSWEDFRGPVTASDEESAAATHCSIGFKTGRSADGKQKVVVYNTFYVNRSWVRSDAKIPSILDHEQGHFDLCEVYTRLLRQRMTNFNFEVADVRSALMAIYDQVTKEYETRQQAYEFETTHGTNIAAQKRWMYAISNELNIAINAVASK